MVAWGSVSNLRKLNNQTVKDVYSLPHIDETLDSLQGSQWFSSLDLKSEYWQVKMDQESKPLTAFTVGQLGFYRCKRMPFGLTNAPATFQRLMETCLGGHQSPLLYHLSGWYSHLLQGSGQPPQEVRDCVSGNWRRQDLSSSLQNVSYSSAADCLFRACDFHSRRSHWWRQNQCYQDLGNAHKCHWGPKFLGIHGILPLIYP